TRLAPFPAASPTAVTASPIVRARFNRTGGRCTTATRMAGLWLFASVGISISVLFDIGAIAWRQRIAVLIGLFPRRQGGRVIGTRGVRRVFDELHPVDVARAVGKNARGGDSNDEYRAWIFAAQRIGVAQLRRAIDANALLSFEVDEDQPDMRIDD